MLKKIFGKIFYHKHIMFNNSHLIGIECRYNESIKHNICLENSGLVNNVNIMFYQFCINVEYIIL